MKPHRRRKRIAALGAVVILSILVISVGDLRSRPQFHLLILSDDAGLSSAVNDSTIHSIPRVEISAVSMMVMSTGFDEVAEHARIEEVAQETRGHICKALVEPALKGGNPAFDFIETNNEDVPSDQQRVNCLNVLRNLQPGISEFVIHCSVNRRGTLLPNAPDRRAADAALFTSLEIQEEVRRLGIRVLG